MFMHDQKHSNPTSTHTHKNICVFSLPPQNMKPNMESILLLSLMWKNVYSARIVIQTQAIWKTMNAAPRYFWSAVDTHWARG